MPKSSSSTTTTSMDQWIRVIMLTKRLSNLSALFEVNPSSAIRPCKACIDELPIYELVIGSSLILHPFHATHPTAYFSIEGKRHNPPKKNDHNFVDSTESLTDYTSLAPSLATWAQSLGVRALDTHSRDYSGKPMIKGFFTFVNLWFIPPTNHSEEGFVAFT